MSITSDIRGYADSAVNQGKQVLGTAQAQLNGVTGTVTSTANEFVGKAVNLEAISTAVEPYVAQLKEYTTVVTDKVEGLVNGVRGDKRVALVLDTVQHRVVEPLSGLTGLPRRTSAPAPKPAAPAAKPARKPAATRSAATRPAAKRTTRKATSASSS
jgi:hypothetical protein